MSHKETTKPWFKTGLIPTQAQFYSFFDFLRWKDEKIPVSDIQGIENILNAKAEAAVLTNHLTDEDAHADQFNAKEDKDQKGAVNGYAPLNEFVKIASQYLNIVDDLVTGGTDLLLSAEQGKELQIQIDGIKALLVSDNVDLDNVQELVDAIETLQISLSTILVNDLTTGGVTKALTAEQGKVLKGLVDALASLYSRNGAGDLVAGVNDQPYEQRVLVGYQNSIGSNYKHQVKGNTYSSNYGYAALGFLAPLFGDFTGGITLVPGSGKWTSNSKIVAPRFQLNFGYTVATLPIGVSGDIAYVNDALSPLALSPIVGGGTVNCLVMYNGAINQWMALSGSGNIQTQINTINTLLASDDINFDTLQELVNAIKSMQTSLNSILVNDLTTGGTTKALTAEMGKSLKGLIDQLVTIPINVQDGSTYTFQSGDANKLVIGNYTYGLTATIPNNSTVAFPIGTVLNAYSRGDNYLGMTIAAASGVTILNSDLVFLPKTHLQLRKIGTNTWYISKTQENFVKLRVNTDNGVFSKSGSIHYIDGNDFDSYEVGDTFFRKGNFFLKGANNGSGLATKSFGSYNSNIPRNMAGLGLDATMQACNFNLGLDLTAYGLTSLALTGYEYHNTLADRGYTNVHPDMAAGALFNFIGSFGEDTQMYVDCRGQLFIKGGSGNGGNNGAWKKYSPSNSGTFTPVGTANLTYKKCFWEKVGNLVNFTVNGNFTGIQYQDFEIELPNSFTYPNRELGSVLGTSVLLVYTGDVVTPGTVMVVEGNNNSSVKILTVIPDTTKNYQFSVKFSLMIN